MTTPAGYDLDPPTEARLLASLTAAFDPDTAKTLVTLAARKMQRRNLRTTDDVIKATEILMDIGDRLRVTSRSEKIRAVTHRALHAAVN
ncbi:hypothetical protein [Actinoplanes xinjiangensis]|uniref:hypothetical protein n=1 Tax=Actinoplanes xinjiangensis TaxID=512350 RepID=UPI0034163E94